MSVIKVERKRTVVPDMASEAPQTASEKQGVVVPIRADTPVKKAHKPMESIDGRDYRKMYRAICDFHERHRLTRLPLEGYAAYWAKVDDDITCAFQQFESDPFIVAMIVAVTEELEREYKTLVEEQEACERREQLQNEAAGRLCQ